MKSGKWMSKLHSLMDFLKKSCIWYSNKVLSILKVLTKWASSSDPSMDWCKHLRVGIYALISWSNHIVLYRLAVKPVFTRKWVGADTSPSYLLFQTLLPLFWTLTCMIWMELTRTDVVFCRIAMVLFMCRNKSSQNDLKLHETYFWKILKILQEESMSGGPHLTTGVGGTPTPLGAPPASGAPWCSTGLNFNSIYSWSGRKQNREKDSSRFTLQSRRHLLFFLGRADLESVRGSEEGKSSPSSSSTILHHQFHNAHRCAWVIPS